MVGKSFAILATENTFCIVQYFFVDMFGNVFKYQCTVEAFVLDIFEFRCKVFNCSVPQCAFFALPFVVGGW